MTKIFLQNFELPAMTWDEFFIMYEEFQNNFWKFYKKFPTNPIFWPHLPKILGFLVFGAQQQQFASLNTL